jgi:hypothetical protein
MVVVGPEAVRLRDLNQRLALQSKDGSGQVLAALAPQGAGSMGAGRLCDLSRAA